MASRIVLINLDKRTDRLGHFHAQIGDIPSISNFTRVRAVSGAETTVPSHFISGPGAWGCRCSHLRILEDAIMDNVNSLCVFEDDVIFCKNFQQKFNKFMEKVPSDWQGIMLGGQEMSPSQFIGIDGVKRAKNTQRTHAYMLRGKTAMQNLYRIWSKSDKHIDHYFGQFQQQHYVYQPDPFLCGQGETTSDISGNSDHVRFWGTAFTQDELKYDPLYIIKCPKDVITRLRKLGVHIGYSLNDDGIDKGTKKLAVTNWDDHSCKSLGNLLVNEAAERGDVAAIWYPINIDAGKLTEKFQRPIMIVEAESIREAVRKMPEVLPHYVAADVIWIINSFDKLLLDSLSFYGFKYGDLKDVNLLLESCKNSRKGKALVTAMPNEIKDMKNFLRGCNFEILQGSNLKDIVKDFNSKLARLVSQYNG